MTATGRGAQIGVLIKNAEALERLAKVDVLIVDKTGTLTEGKPKLAGVIAQSDYQEEEVLLSLRRSKKDPNIHWLTPLLVLLRSAACPLIRQRTLKL